MSEIYKDIPGLKGYYQISTLGNLRSVDRTVKDVNGRLMNLKGKQITSRPATGGYLNATLSIDCKFIRVRIHQLVAITFLNHKPKGHALVVHHINNIPTDNRLVNLELRTNRENTRTHAYSSSKYKGVCWNKAKNNWLASIRIGKERLQKSFKHEFEAFMWYEKQKRLILS